MFLNVHLEGELESPLWRSDEDCAIAMIPIQVSQTVYLWNMSDHFIGSLLLLNLTVSIVYPMPFTQHSVPQILTIAGTFQQLCEFEYLNISFNPLSIIALLEGTENEAEKLIYIFWSRKLYDIITIVNGILLKSVHIGCGNHQITNFGMCSSSVNNTPSFPVRDCNFLVNWIETEPFFIGSPSDGVEYMLLKMIMNVSGLNIVWYREANFGFSANGTWTGALGHLEDLAAGGFMMTANRHNDFLMTYPHFYDCYRWFAPLPASRQTWYGKDTLNNARHLLLLFFMCCCFSIFSKNERMFSSPTLCCLNTLRVALSQPIRKTPKRSATRILFISWVCYQMIINTIYSGTLVESLTKKKEQTVEIGNLERRSCLPPALDMGNNTGVPIEPCDIRKVSRRLAIDRNFTLLTAVESTKFVSERNFLPIRAVGEPYVHRYNTFILPKHSKYYGKINKLIYLAFETGLIKKLTADVHNRYIVKRNSATNESSLDMTLVVAVFVGGCGLASAAFLMELYLK